jgi:hypothetical protein
MKRTRFAGFVLISVLLASGQVFPQDEEPTDSQPPPSDETKQGGEEEQGFVLVGAGDIANCNISGGHLETANVLDSIPGTVFTMGDHAYPSGSKKSFEECYGQSWGRHKERTRPSPGNHDMRTRNGLPYYNYFGENAGPKRLGYYSYNLGEWHIISLNSDISVRRRSKQYKWLQQDLEENQATCMLAYWHVPVFSSGAHGNHRGMLDAWRLLYDSGADVIVGGHDHSYERFAPQDPNGKADPERGIRQFVVGTGGAGVYRFNEPVENSEVRHWQSYGVIKFTLYPDRYDWEFVTAKGQEFQDKGSARCSP